MQYTIEQIASALGLTAEGDLSLTVTGASEPANAGPDQLALAMSPEFVSGLSEGRARAAMLWQGSDWGALGLQAAILAPRPRYAMSGLTALMDAGPQIAAGIHPSAVIDPTARIGANASIGPFVVIGASAVVGDNARIAAHVTLGVGAEVGEGALILERVHIGHHCRIGARFTAQPGAVIGGDGFSFVTPEPDAVEAVRGTLGDRGGRQQQAYARIHSLGAVAIGDDVEIGANACIDRGTIADTVIGRGTKIDNLVQVGHNARIGEDCLLCGLVGIAGSTHIGNRCVLGGQVGVTDHLEIGDDVLAGAGTLLRTNQPSGRVMLGNPAMEMPASIEAYKNLRRLPRLMSQVAALRKSLSNGDSSD